MLDTQLEKARKCADPCRALRTRAPRRTGDLEHRSEEHTSELQSHVNLVCRLLLEKKKKHKHRYRKRRKTKNIRTINQWHKNTHSVHRIMYNLMRLSQSKDL